MRVGPPGPARILSRSALAAALVLALLPAPALAQAPFFHSYAAQELSNQDDSAIADFYRARDGRPLWLARSLVEGPASQLLAMLDRADLDGLDPDKYRSLSLKRALSDAEGGSPRAIAQADFELSRAFTAYVRDLRSSGSSGTVFIDQELKPAVPDVRKLLEAAAAAPSLGGYLTNMSWMHPIYSQIRRAYANDQLDFGRDQLDQMVRINLERARALPVDFGQRYIVVDAAAARLYMYEHGRIQDTMKIVVGKPSSPTPMMAALMRHAILNPYWNVPSDLAAERIAPSAISHD